MCQWSFYASWIWRRYMWQGSFPVEFVLAGRNFGTFSHETWNWAITKHTFATFIFVICIKLYGLAPVQKNPSKFLRIDKYWSKVGKIYESGNVVVTIVHLNVVFSSTKYYLTLMVYLWEKMPFLHFLLAG